MRVFDRKGEYSKTKQWGDTSYRNPVTIARRVMRLLQGTGVLSSVTCGTYIDQILSGTFFQLKFEDSNTKA